MPLPKSGSQRVPKNWRPVVLLPCMSKILETVLNNQLKCYLEDNGLMSLVQHAYRRSRSCSTAWMELDMRIRDAQKRFKHSVLVCTDQSAAFNLVTWPIILAKLEILGMDELSQWLVNGERNRGRLSVWPDVLYKHSGRCRK